MPQCAAFGCTNSSSYPDQRQTEGLTFHRFPMNKRDILKHWVKNVKRKNFTPNSNSRLYPQHFVSKCFETSKLLKFGISPTGKRRRLNPDAVPTFFAQSTSEKSQQQQRMSSIARRAKADREEQMTLKLMKETPAGALSTTPVIRTEQVTGPSSRKIKRVASSTVTQSTAPVEGDEHVPVEGPKRHPTHQLQIVEMESLGGSVLQPILDIEAGVAITTQQTPVFILPSSIEYVKQYGTPKRTQRDHPYAVGPYRSFGTQTKRALMPSPVKIVTLEPKPASSPLQPQSESETEKSPDDDDLASYLPSSDVTSEEESDPDTKEPDSTNMSKHIIFQENLDQLHRFCNKCGAPNLEKSSFTTGSMIGYRINCHNGHSYVWHSQPQQNKQPLGNLLIAAATLISGNTYAKIHALTGLLKLAILPKAQFNKIQRENVLPVIQQCWEEEKKKAQDEVRTHNSLVLSGDGRCDSPGHTAKSVVPVSIIVCVYNGTAVIKCDSELSGQRK